MSAAATLFVRVAADIGDVKPKLAAVAAEAHKMGSAVSGASQSAASSLDRVASSASSLGDIFKGTLAGNLAANAMQAAAGEALNLGKAALSLAGDLEESRIAFRTMLGSAEKADAFLRELARFAASTPFEMAGLQAASKRLLAFGFDAQAVIPLVNSVGNAVAAVGGGAAAIDGVTMALGQMAAKGKVSAEEMNQLAERGINGWAFLAEKMGKSTAEVQKMAEKGQISAATAITAIVNGMNQKFGGLMAEQSRTFKGALSNLKDSSDQLLTRIGTKFIETFNITGIIATAAAALAGLAGTIDSVGLVGLLDRVFPDELKATIVGIGAAVTAYVVPALGTAIVTAASAAASAIAAATVAFAPYIAAGVAVSGLAYVIIKNWEPIKGWFVSLWNGMSNAAGTFFDNLRGGFQQATAWVAATAHRIAATLGPVLAHIPGVGADLAAKLQSAAAAVDHNMAFMSKAAIKHVNMIETAASHNWSVLSSGITDVFGQAQTSVGGYMRGIFGDMKGLAGDFGKTLTENMLGLDTAAAKAADGVGKAAKRASSEAKRAAEDAKRAMTNIGAGLRGLVDLTRFAAIPGIFANMNKGLDDVAKHTETASAGFNQYAARAMVLSDTLSKLESAGLSKLSPAYRKLTADFKAATLAAERQDRAIADLGDVFKDLSRDLQAAEAKAQVFGPTFGLAAAQADALRGALNRALSQKTIDWQAVERLKQQLDEVTATIPPTTTAFEDFKAKMEGTAQSVSLMREGLATIGQALGATFADPVMAAAARVLDLGLAVTQVVAAAPGVVKGLQAIGAAITTSLGPWGLVVAGIGVAVGALASLAIEQTKTVTKTKVFVDEYGEQLEIMVKETENKALDMGDIWDWMTDRFDQAKNFIAGLITAPYRTPFPKLRNEIDSAAIAFARANKESSAFYKNVEDLSKGFASSFNSSLGSAVKGFLDGTKSIQDGLRVGIKDSIVGGIVDAMLQKDFIGKQLGGLMDELSDAMVRHGAGSTEASRVIEQIGAKVPAMAAGLEATLGTLRKTLDRAFNPQGDRIAAILADRQAAFKDTAFKAGTLGSLDQAGALSERITATEKAMTDLRDAGAQTSNQFGDLGIELAKFREQLAGIKAAGDQARDAGKQAEAMANAYAPTIASLQGQLAKLLDSGQGGGAAYASTLANLQAIQAEMRVPALAAGGLTTGPALAMVGEGRHQEAVLPLSDEVYGRIGRGIARNSGGGAGGATISLAVNYYGNGKWTRQDADELGELLVQRLRGLGLRN